MNDKHDYYYYYCYHVTSRVSFLSDFFCLTNSATLLVLNVKFVWLRWLRPQVDDHVRVLHVYVCILHVHVCILHEHVQVPRVHKAYFQTLHGSTPQKCDIAAIPHPDSFYIFKFHDSPCAAPSMMPGRSRSCMLAPLYWKKGGTSSKGQSVRSSQSLGHD